MNFGVPFDSLRKNGFWRNLLLQDEHQMKQDIIAGFCEECDECADCVTDKLFLSC